ncbi:hypothetical protein [Nocardioides pelophilus]|uniref:hypothetical protein n=1 Tax=Nocardioides pelophilus TaxID=2172019 RepID=UPI0015FFE43F|nr:hypothetical protein [Nocardioides pelophilus]
MTTLPSTRSARRTPARALRPARVALILEVEYRRAKRDLRQRVADREHAPR